MGYQHRADTEHLSLHDGKKFDTTNNSFFTYKQIRPIMDTDTFTFTKKSEDYYLYVGRILEAKGIGILLSLVTQFPDKKFVFMFSSYHTPHALDDAKNVTIYTAPEFEKKVEIIRNARALISPTLASECFGSAHIEGQLCGVPSITTD
jgi:glycosyltransferase involved in cell wall biosynthesis